MGLGNLITNFGGEIETYIYFILLLIMDVDWPYFQAPNVSKRKGQLALFPHGGRKHLIWFPSKGGVIEYGKGSKVLF